MPYCLKCKTEYESAYTVCADCGADLVNRPPDERTDGPAPVLVLRANNPQEALIARATLQAEGIPAFVLSGDPALPQSARAVTQTPELDVFVPAELAGRAGEILNARLSDEELTAAEIQQSIDGTESSKEEGAMDMFQWHAGLIERAGKFLAHGIETTDQTKLEWCPAVDDTSKCRSVVDQAGECVRLNENFAAKIAGREPSPGAPVDASNAAARVRESSRALAALVRDMKPEDLGTVHDMGFMKLPGAGVIEVALNNMVYHCGQINQLQLMYGDTEFRIPPDYFS